MNKKLILIVFVLFSLFLSSCNSPQQSSPEPKPVASEPVEQETADTEQNTEQAAEVITETNTVIPESGMPEKEIPVTEAVPGEKEEQTETVPENICTFSVSCSEILENMDKLSENKKDIIPENGIIVAPQKIEYTEGETVFQLLKRVLTENKIHFEFNENPMYNSAYIEGIANIYEFDCGDMSGWLFFVNGEAPRVGCSQYVIKSGDVIEFRYTCN